MFMQIILRGFKDKFKLFFPFLCQSAPQSLCNSPLYFQFQSILPTIAESHLSHLHLCLLIDVCSSFIGELIFSFQKFFFIISSHANQFFLYCLLSCMISFSNHILQHSLFHAIFPTSSCTQVSSQFFLQSKAS